MSKRQKTLFCLIFVFFFLFFLSNSFAQTCGDGGCNGGENSCSCPQDCGACEGEVPNQLCREYACRESICAINVLANCCGNQACEATEDYGNCPVDCTPKNIELEVLSPDSGPFFRGDKILFKVRVTADGREISSPFIAGTGDFGALPFFNDGKHNDGLAADNVFAAEFTVPTDANAGEKTVDINAVFLGVRGGKRATVKLDSALGLDVRTNDFVELGKNMEISVGVTKKGVPIASDFNVAVLIAGKIVFSFSGMTDNNSAQLKKVIYRSSLLDPRGEWNVVVKAMDGFSNEGVFEKTVTAIRPQAIKPLNIEFEKDVEKKYLQGENIDFVVRLVNDSQEIVKNAKVLLKGSGLDALELLETEPGKYARSIKVSREFKNGFNEFEVEATVDSGNLHLKSVEKVVVEIASSGLKVEIIEPSNLSYGVGEKMDLLVKVTDFDGELVNDATVKALVNGKEVVLALVKLGTYRAQYDLGSSDEGKTKIDFSAVDAFGNEGLRVLEVTIGGKSFFYDVLQNVLVFGVIVAILIVVGIAGMRFVRSKKGSKDLQKKILEIEKNEQDVQKKYFHDHAISKEEYLSVMEKYENDKKKLDDGL